MYVVSLDFVAAWDLKRDAEVIAACGGDLMLGMSLLEDQVFVAALQKDRIYIGNIKH